MLFRSPGHSRVATLVLPALSVSGTYRVVVDMVDEQQGWFHQFGSEPLEWEVVVSSQ